MPSSTEQKLQTDIQKQNLSREDVAVTTGYASNIEATGATLSASFSKRGQVGSDFWQEPLWPLSQIFNKNQFSAKGFLMQVSNS